MAKKRKGDVAAKGAKPWSTTISQQQLSRHPGEMAARKLAAENLERADSSQRKALEALRGNQTIYD